LIQEILNLTKRIQKKAESSNTVTTSNQDNNAQPSRQEELEKLRALPAKDLRELFALRHKTTRLLGAISKAQEGLDALRKKRGNPADFLWGDPKPDDVKLSEIRRKVRELKALRRRWWSDRQDPQTTVRRALAVVDLPEDSEADDKPPSSEHKTLFERIRSTWTLV